MSDRETVPARELRDTFYGSPTKGTKRGLRALLNSRRIPYRLDRDGWPWTTRTALNAAILPSDGKGWQPGFARQGSPQAR